MGYAMEVRGALEFESEVALERGLDALAAEEHGCAAVDVLDLDVRERHIVVALVRTVPAVSWRPTSVALGALARRATSGSLELVVRFDIADRTILAAGGFRDAPAPRHHRWALCLAAHGGNDAKAHDALVAGADPDAKLGRHGLTALHVASSKGHVAVVRTLLGHGADPAVVDAEGRTPTALAASKAIVDLLRSPRARAPDAEVLGRQLRNACMLEQVSRSLELIALGAADGPLVELRHAVLESGSVEVWDAVVGRGRDWREAFVSRGSDGPSTWARALGRGGSLELLRRVRALSIPIPMADLLEAAASGDHGFLEALLEEPDAVGACGRSDTSSSAMCRAAVDGRLDAMRVLFAHGIPLHPEGEFEMCPLHAAAGSGRGYEAMVWLLERGVPVGARNRRGESALSYARFGAIDSMVELVARGLSPDDRDAEGNRPWDSAFHPQRFAELVASLTARGLPVPSPQA